MSVPFHYVVKGRFIRRAKSDQLDFVCFEKKFEHNNPILARISAFQYFENYLDVLNDSGEDIKDRFKPQNTNEKEVPPSDAPHLAGIDTISELEERLKFHQKYYDQDHYYFRDRLEFINGIGIFLIMDAPLPSDSIDSTQFESEDYPIYGIDHNGDLFYPEVLIDGLTTEYDYYHQFKFDTQDYLINVKYHYSGKLEPEEEIILKTPFDWDKLFSETEAMHRNRNVPLMGDPFLPDFRNLSIVDVSVLQIVTYSIDTIKEFLKKGEGKQIEFKSTLLFNPQSQRAGIGIKAVIAKTICSFLNTIGGLLFIGVNDSGKIIGLNSDFKLSDKSDPKDFFKLEFDEMIYHFFTRDVHTYIQGDFVTIENKTIFLVTVHPSRKPVFAKNKEGKKFFIRGTASSQLLDDPEEITNYCLAHHNFIGK